MKVAIGGDHAGFEYKSKLIEIEQKEKERKSSALKANLIRRLVSNRLKKEEFGKIVAYYQWKALPLMITEIKTTKIKAANSATTSSLAT